MRTSYLTDAKNKLSEALENKDKMTQEGWVAMTEAVFNDIKMTSLFARNTDSKGFLASTNMSEDQVRETDQFKRIAGLAAGEGCTLTIEPDLYRYIRWIAKRDTPIARFRTIKLGDNLISVSRIA